MTYYNADANDLSLFALGNFFDINIVIVKSNEREYSAEDLMKNDGCNRETVFVKTWFHVITSSDDSVEITNVLQETKGDDEVQEVKPRSSRIVVEKQIRRMILVLNVTCFHVFFLSCKIIFLRFIFMLNTGKNQHWFCDILISFGSYMTENYFKICRKCNDKFF